jgi:S1-C subfamily serine protease
MISKSILPAALLMSAALTVNAGELAEKGRAVFQQHQHEVVTVQVVQKMTSAAGGRTSEPRESRQDLTGTVVDPSGLTVLALSAADPGEMYKRMYPESSGYKLEVEVSDIKILLDDGTELPAEIVLRDKDLDLAFIRPKTKPAQPLPAVNLSQAAPAQMLDELITINRLGRAAGRVHAASVELVSAVVQKPRTFYIPDSRMTGTALGSPAFALDGRIVGIMVMRTISAAGGTSLNNFRPDNATSIILPAADVAKAMKQAPEAKSADEPQGGKPGEAKAEK